MTTIIDRPPHRCQQHSAGTAGCYVRDGCRCVDCTRARAREAKLSRNGHTRQVPAIGVIRRLQSLTAAGWTRAAVAQQVGVSERTIESLLRRGPDGTVWQRTHRRVHDAWTALSLTPVTGDRVAWIQGHAHAKGWPPPLAWDEGTGRHGIDNPDATPVRGWRRDPRNGGVFMRAADLIDAIDGGASMADLVQRTGHREESILRSLARVGRRDLASRIRPASIDIGACA